MICFLEFIACSSINDRLTPDPWSIVQIIALRSSANHRSRDTYLPWHLGCLCVFVGVWNYTCQRCRSLKKNKILQSRHIKQSTHEFWTMLVQNSLAKQSWCQPSLSSFFTSLLLAIQLDYQPCHYQLSEGRQGTTFSLNKLSTEEHFRIFN